MKTFGALLAVILFASSPVLGQADNPNAELDLWREAMADYNRRSEEVRQQYAADRELWRTHFEEATRPLSTGKKILKGLAYAGDKTLTGAVNYYSSRAAIRSEMGRYDSRFESLRDGIQASRTDILGANERSRTDILGANERSRTDILGANERSTADVLAGIREAEADITDRIGRQGETSKISWKAIALLYYSFWTHKAGGLQLIWNENRVRANSNNTREIPSRDPAPRRVKCPGNL